jgi:DNA-binding response OmpR family regulator
MNGEEMVKGLRAAGVTVPIIVLTGGLTAGAHTAVLAAGANACFDKFGDLEVLLEEINRLLAKSGQAV